MRKFHGILLTLLSLACVARAADNTLIYNGVYSIIGEGDGTVGRSALHIFFVIDLSLTSNNEEVVVYGIDPGHGKTYSASTNPQTFNYGVIATSAAASQTILVSATSSGGNSLSTTLFTGPNRLLALGGGFNGAYAPVLRFSALMVVPQTPPSNPPSYGEEIGAGSFALNIPLTRAANSTAGNNLSNAVGVVVGALTRAGYKP